MNFRRHLILWPATGGGIGYVPWAPGTLGTIVGLPLCYGMAQLPLPWALTGIVGFIGVAIGIAGAAEKVVGRKDPGCIVIDEIAGLMVALAGMGWHLRIIVAGFVLFRCFDILKPFPIRYLERRLKGGTGIVLDDVAAGIIVNITLRIVLKLIEITI
jgi:phosphatidylglycerophosphatase A